MRRLSDRVYRDTTHVPSGRPDAPHRVQCPCGNPDAYIDGPEDIQRWEDIVSDGQVACQCGRVLIIAEGRVLWTTPNERSS